MREAFIDHQGHVEVRDMPVPSPGPGQVLIKTVISGTNPKDWKVPKVLGEAAHPSNQGDDIAGFVVEVGEGVYGFHPGDRVAAFHEMLALHGSYAEFSVAWAKSTFHIAPHTTFEEAATVPLAAMTAALGVHQRLKLPLPWSPATETTPLIVYGGASAVGAFAIKLASLANVHPIVAVAGSGIPYVETLLDRSRGDRVVDYRQGADHVVRELGSVTPTDAGTVYAMDAVSEKGSVENLGRVQVPDMRVATVLQRPAGAEDLPAHVRILYTNVGTVHRAYNRESEACVPADRKFGAAFFPFMGIGLAEGWFRGHPHEVVEEGLDGLEGALKRLEEGRVSAKKLVLRVSSGHLGAI